MTRLLLPLGTVRVLDDAVTGSFLGGLSGNIKVPIFLDCDLLAALGAAGMTLLLVLLLLLLLLLLLFGALRVSTIVVSTLSIGYVDSTKDPSLVASFCSMYNAERTAALAMGMEYPCKSMTMGLGVIDSLVSNSCEE